MAAAFSRTNLTITKLPSVWPEPIQRVQALSESGLDKVPSRYIRPESERPTESCTDDEDSQVPVIDMSGLVDVDRRESTLRAIASACEEWGFFQVVNHGIPLPLLQRAQRVAKQFFELPLEEKQVYANSPSTYEGYGSRIGLDKGAILDWGDYFFLNFLPTSKRDMSKWPFNPTLWRSTMDEYTKQVQMLGHTILEALSCNLNLNPLALTDAFGGDSLCEMSVRMNYYPPCPQPDLTLGLSPHSDPGGITILLQDDEIVGLQVRHDGRWLSVKHVPGALVVNLADQIQILTNEKYKSVEHRVIANGSKQRVTIACFFNPGDDKLMAPLEQLLDKSNQPPLYTAMTFKQYRSFIRRKGTNGKGHVNSISSPR